MKLSNRFIIRIILSFFVLLSTVLNILYLSNVISVNFSKIGFALVMLCNVNFIINAQKKHTHIQTEDKANRAIDIIMIVTMVAWVITYVMTIFR